MQADTGQCDPAQAKAGKSQTSIVACQHVFVSDLVITF
jgi:hypothetical protein